MEVGWFLAKVNVSICCRLSVCLSSVCKARAVHPTQAVVIFRNISMAFGTLAIR